MGYFILIVIFIIILGAVICYDGHRISVLLNAPLICPPKDDALKSANEIGSFLAKRSGFNSNILKDKVGEGKYEWTDVWDIYWGKNYQVVTFIRLCHALGCEVIIRQKGTEDIEQNEESHNQVNV